MQERPQIAVVIPCYRVRDKILGVIAAVPAAVAQIHVVDDACPEKSGDLVAQTCLDARLVVHRHAQNRGVGGAMVTGYRAALAAPTAGAAHDRRELRRHLRARAHGPVSRPG